MDKSSGPDVIYHRLLREGIAGTLAKIIMSSLATGKDQRAGVANDVPLLKGIWH